MRQVVLYGERDLRLEVRPLDSSQLGDHDVYVETEVTALSTGTDLGNYLGHSTDIPGAPAYPRTTGYSNVGKVVRRGAAVKNPALGERVFSMRPHQSAYVASDSEIMVSVPASVSSEQASLAYLTQLGLAALRQARYEAGENVAVVGLGVIGLCTVGLARAMGATVVGIANSISRVEVAEGLGAHAAYLSEQIQDESSLADVFGDAGADVVILTANPWEAYQLSVKIARRGARIAVLGFPGRGQPEPKFNPLDPQWFYGKQLTLIGAGASPRVDCCADEIRFNLRRNLEFILRLMSSGALQLDPVISHRFFPETIHEAYEMASRHDKSLAAAIFDWRV